MKRTLVLMFTIALLIAQNWGVAFASSSEHLLSVNEMLDLAESETRQSVDRYVTQYMEQLRIDNIFNGPQMNKSCLIRLG